VPGNSPVPCVLPDGKTIMSVQPAETIALWREISGDSTYQRACAGLGPSDVIVDAGAHIGLASLCFAAHVPGARILALEPAPVTFGCLQANLGRYAPHAVALCQAAGSEPGTAQLTYRPYMSSMSTLHADRGDDARNVGAYLRNNGTSAGARDVSLQALNVEQSVPVEVTTVTRVMTEHSVDRVGLLKVDVERAELDVINGISEAAWDRIHRVLLEVHDLDEHLGKITGRLAGLGYEATVSQTPLFRSGSVYQVLATRDE
jgi:31-O-methyltransferase